MYQFCVLVVVLQVGAIIYLKQDVASWDSGKKKSVIVPERKRYDRETSAKLSKSLLTRPDRFLADNVKLVSLEEQIHAESHKLVKACQWYRRNTQGKMRVVPDDDCDRPNQDFVVYNPLKHDRFICDGTVVVPAEGFAHLGNNDCKEMTKSRIFTATPTLENAKLMPPITIVGTSGPEESSDKTEFTCDVPCLDARPKDWEVDEFNILGTPWVMQHSMESAAYYPMLAVDLTAHRSDRFYSTTSFDSEIPLPYFSWAEYSIAKPAVEFDKVIKGASFIASNCDSTSGRELVVKELMEYVRVDCLGECLKNAQPPPGVELSDSLSLKRQYLFHLAFENSIQDDCKRKLQCTVWRMPGQNQLTLRLLFVLRRHRKALEHSGVWHTPRIHGCPEHSGSRTAEFNHFMA